MGKKKAPEYATTSYDTGDLFGSSSTSKKGTTYTGTDNINQFGNEAWSGANNALANMNSNDYSNDANFKVYQDDWNRQMNQAYDANVLSNLANRGLMRSSGLQSATNSFNNTMQESLADLYDNYYNRQANNLTANQNALNNLYSWITGINSGSQNNSNNVSNYNLQKRQLEDNSGLWNNLVNATGTAAGGFFSGKNSDDVAKVATIAAASDINVKENIVPIGQKDGYNWYEFDYKKGYGLPEGRQRGVIAQEVEQVNPDAVFEVDGIKHVDYSKL